MTRRPDRHDATTVHDASWAVHGGNRPDRTTGAIRTPIITSNSYRLPRDPDDVDSTDPDFLIYGREAGANQVGLQEKLARYERGEAAAVFASGMAALHATFFTLLNPGDHVIASNVLYMGTWDLLNSLLPKKNGIEVDFVDITDLDAVRKAVRPDTALIHTEAITNPALTVADIAGLAAIAHETGALLTVDSTFTPHQSIKTPSIGLEQPQCISHEPAFVVDVEWTLLAAMGQLGRPGGKSAYVRLSTKPVDQKLAAVPADPAARERRRRQVVAGAYLLRACADPQTTIVAMGALATEALGAADRLAAMGVRADVVCVTSPGLLFEAVQSRHGDAEAASWILDQVFPADRARPMVTVLDGHPHTLAFLAGINRVRARHLGVSGFGQAGDLESVYRYHGIDTDSIVRGALDLVR